MDHVGKLVSKWTALRSDYNINHIHKKTYEYYGPRKTFKYFVEKMNKYFMWFLKEGKLWGPCSLVARKMGPTIYLK